MSKLKIVIGILSLIFFARSVFAGNIREAAILTLENNPDYLSYIAKRRQADEEYRQALSGYLPQVDISGAFGRDRNNNKYTRDSNGGSLTLTKREAKMVLTQMLFDGFAVRNNSLSKIHSINSNANLVYTAAENLVLDMISVYLDVLKKRIIVEHAKENVHKHQVLHQQIEKRSESGFNKKANMELATARFAFARATLMEEQKHLRDAETLFFKIVGDKPHSLIKPTIDTNVVPSSLSAAIAIGLRNNPLIAKSFSDIEVANADKREIKSSFFPTLNLEVTGSKNEHIDGIRGKKDNMSFLLSLKYNVFKGGADTARERVAAWEIERNKEVLRENKRRVEQNVKVVWNSYATVKAQLKYKHDHFMAVARAKDSYENQFTVGQKSLLDLLDLENELFNAKKLYEEAQYMDLFGKYEVLHSMGELIKHMRLALPEAAEYKADKWWEGF